MKGRPLSGGGPYRWWRGLWTQDAAKAYAWGMTAHQPNNPLHGITLEMVLTRLVQHYGWAELWKLVNIQCFYNEPSIKSSLKFLRKTPWARQKVEEIYLSLR